MPLVGPLIINPWNPYIQGCMCVCVWSTLGQRVVLTVVNGGTTSGKVGLNIIQDFA